MEVGGESVDEGEERGQSRQEGGRSREGREGFEQRA